MDIRCSKYFISTKTENGGKQNRHLIFAHFVVMWRSAKRRLCLFWKNEEIRIFSERNITIHLRLEMEKRKYKRFKKGK